MELKDILAFKYSPQIREKLSDIGFTKKFAEGDVILNENAYIKAIPIVTKGNIRVMRTDDDGREILLYYIKAGESCIMSFLGGMHNDTSKVKAIAEEETEILFIPIDKVTVHNPAQSGQSLPVKVNSKLRVKSGHFSGAN